MTTRVSAKIGNTDWHLISINTGSAECEHCGRNLTHVYTVENPNGVEMVVGRACVKKLTGWTLAAVPDARMLAAAQTRARRAASWTQFSVDHPGTAALIEADIAAYERVASSGASASASHEVKTWICDRAGNAGWVSATVDNYLRRRGHFSWV